MDQERKAEILEGMVKRRQWGMNYKPLEETAAKLPTHKRREALDVIEQLVQDGLAEYHKNRNCVSLNPSRKKEIRRFLEEHGRIEEWVLDHLI